MAFRDHLNNVKIDTRELEDFNHLPSISKDNLEQPIILNGFDSNINCKIALDVCQISVIADTLNTSENELIDLIGEGISEPLEPSIIDRDSAPVLQNSLEKVKLSELPIPQYFPVDAGKYLTSAMVFVMDEGISNIEILPETKNTIKWLGDNNISTGVTTGFSKPVMNAIKEKLINDDIHIDKYVSSTCLGRPGRPNPHMMNSIINHLSIADRKRVIKIDDTCVGIEEGKNAGALTVGVAKWSTNMKMIDYNQDKNMSKEEYVERLKNSREALRLASPDYVIDSLDELPRIINMINSECN